MTVDTRIQELVRRIAQERSLSLGDARRWLIEEIDRRKRVLAAKQATARGDTLLAYPTSSGVRMKTENPFRRIPEQPGDTPPPEITKKPVLHPRRMARGCCAACGCPYDENTPGCTRCAARHIMRRHTRAGREALHTAPGTLSGQAQRKGEPDLPADLDDSAEAV